MAEDVFSKFHEVSERIVMEIADVLAALEELKNGIAAVNSANENVEKAATAARKVCEAFASCSSQLQGFPETVMNPIKDKVAEISEASSRMVKTFSTTVEDLRSETKKISDSFNATILASCERIQSDIAEFHREVESFDAKLSRMTNRVEEKTNTVADEVRKLASKTDEDIQRLGAAQAQSAERINATVESAKSALKSDLTAVSDGVCKTISHEADKITSGVDGARQELLGGVRSSKTAAVVAAISASVAAACAIVLALKTFGVI